MKSIPLEKLVAECETMTLRELASLAFITGLHVEIKFSSPKEVPEKDVPLHDTYLGAM